MIDKTLELKNVSKTYIGGYLALSEVSLMLDKGARLCVIGEQNSGKSTLLKIIAGLETHDGGQLLINGCEPDGIKRRDIGYYTLAEMPPNKKVFDVLAYPLIIRKSTDVKESVFAAARKFRIENLLNLKIKDLNALLKITVSLARLFIVKRGIYLLDNPFKTLSFADRITMDAELKTILSSVEGAVLLTSDSVEEAAFFGFDNNAILTYSVLSRCGRLWELRQNPPNLAAAKILDSTASTLSYNTVKEAYSKAGIQTSMPQIIGYFSDIGLLTYSDDFIIGSGELEGNIIDIAHTAKNILYRVEVGNDKIVIAQKPDNRIESKGCKIKFGIKNLRPFDMISEQSILK